VAIYIKLPFVVIGKSVAVGDVGVSNPRLMVVGVCQQKSITKGRSKTELIWGRIEPRVSESFYSHELS